MWDTFCRARFLKLPSLGGEDAVFRTDSIIKLLSIGVLLFWLVMVGLLVRKTYFQPVSVYISSGEGEEQLIFSEQWMGIYHKGQKIGYSSSKIEKEEEGFRMVEKAFMKLTLLGIPRVVETNIDAILGRDYRLKSFHFALRSGPVRFDLDGRIKGREMTVEIGSAGRKTIRRIMFRQVPALFSNLRYRLLRYNLKKGKRISVPLFDPATLSNHRVLVEVEGEETLEISGAQRRVIRLKMTLYGMPFYSWISPHGELLKEEGLMGLTLIKETKTEALTMHWGKGGSFDFIRSTSIPVENPIRNPRTTAYLKVRLRKAPSSGFSFPGKRQKRWGNQVIVQKEDLGTIQSYTIPYRAEADLDDYLRSSALIQAGDPEIVKVSREIVGGQKDALAAVRRIVKWVYVNLKKRPVMSIPSAVEVLKLMEGDCNEHTVLFTALARASGIPTKVAVGLLYMDGRFYYHAWPEVYLGGWVAVDPLMNQIPADATHIKYVEGGLDKQVAMIQLIGRLKIDVLEYR